MVDYPCGRFVVAVGFCFVFFYFYERAKKHLRYRPENRRSFFTLHLFPSVSISAPTYPPPRFCELSNACFSFLRLLCVVYWSPHPLYMSSNPVLCSTLVFSRRSLLSTNPGAALPHPPLTNTVYIPPGGEASSSLSFVLYDVCDVLSNARGRCFM